MKIRDLTTDDLNFMAEHSVSRGLKEYPATVDLSFALEDDGQLIGTGGLKLLNKTSAWCWMDWTAEAKGTPYTVFRIVDEYLEKLAKDLGLRCVMAAVRIDFPEAIRTVEHLGFQREGTMVRFYGDSDADFYVRTF